MLSPTIVTLTMNPALDITTEADVVRPTDKVRCAGARYDPGGGGINVARIAHVLGASVSAIFPAGGPSGDLVTRLVHDAGVPLRQINITDPTRESFTINERSTGKQYPYIYVYIYGYICIDISYMYIHMYRHVLIYVY